MAPSAIARRLTDPVPILEKKRKKRKRGKETNTTPTFL
jgi:hypothetical protein